MSKIRVHEIAKELGLSSREALQKLADLGIEVKSHSSSLEESDAGRLRDSLNGKGAASAKPDQATAGPGPVATPEEAVASSAAGGPPVAAAGGPAETKAGPARAPQAAAPPARPVAPAPEPAASPTPSANGKAGALQVQRGVTVEEFAAKVGKPAGEIIKMLLAMGEMRTINQSLPDEAVDLLASELNVTVQLVSADVPMPGPDEQESEQEDPSKLQPRPPIVTVMGHVDHGKSSILQFYRRKEMLALEAGGITQAVGAYQVHDPKGGLVTFIDTPGHEAFTQMRARGAQLTDLVILVVAADDGVRPQTVEALDHAKAAGVPIIVAVNKIDKPEADPTRTRQQLAEHGLQPEEWGGETVFVDVSAKQGTNLDDLLEMIHLMADMQELRANPDAPARGVVVEAHLDKGRGAAATLIVQKGTLKVGDPVVCGTAWCKVRSLSGESGQPVKKAGPSQPVLVTGWSKVPVSGDEFKVVADEREAKRTSAERDARHRQAEFASSGKAVSLEDLLSQTRSGELPELKLILKADSQGSLEALFDSIAKMDQSMVRTNVLRRAVGAINENDVTLAEASGAIVVGFNVRPDAGARQLAERQGVDVRLYEVIYQLLEDIERATRGLLAPVQEEVVTGAAEVRATFKIPRGMVAGSYVTEGTVSRNSRARLLRDGKVIYTGVISSLRRFKDDVREVSTGYECGITIEGFADIKEGDVIEAFEVREVARV